jgi:ABC-2 type transport system ATP-binding protein
VTEASGLKTWSVTGEDLWTLARGLKTRPGIEMVVPFGNVLHVSGTEAQALEASIAPYRADLKWHWTPSAPGLEDVFIKLMQQAQDDSHDNAVH